MKPLAEAYLTEMETKIEEDMTTMWIDTGTKPPSSGTLLVHRNPCSFCGWCSNLHLHSVEISDANVEAKLRYSDDGTLKVIDYRGASFEVKFAHCPLCGAKLDKEADDGTTD